MIKRLTYSAIVASVATACATVTPGIRGMPKTPSETPAEDGRTASGLVVYCQQDGFLSTEYLKAYSFTFSNRTSDWIRVNGAVIDLDSPARNRQVVVTAGADLEAWYQAIRVKRAVETHNRSVALGTLGLMAGAAAASSRHLGVQAAGSVSAVAALGSLTVAQLNASAVNSSRGAIFPGSHLMAGRFVVPPGLFAKKWILLDVSGADGAISVEALRLKYEVDGGGAETVTFQLRQPTRSIASSTGYAPSP